MARKVETYDDGIIRDKDGNPNWKIVTKNNQLTKREEEATKPIKGNSYNNKKRQAYMSKPNVKEFNREMVKKSMTGRPCMFDNVGEVENGIVDYFALCDRTDTVPTITGIATWLHCSRDTIYRHANDSNSPFSDVFKNAINTCHLSLENGAIDGAVNSVVYIFMGKNYFGLKDDKNITVTPATSNSTNSQETMDAIQKQIEEENVPNADYQED